MSSQVWGSTLQEPNILGQVLPSAGKHWACWSDISSWNIRDKPKRWGDMQLRLMYRSKVQKGELWCGPLTLKLFQSLPGFAKSFNVNGCKKWHFLLPKPCLTHHVDWTWASLSMALWCSEPGEALSSLEVFLIFLLNLTKSRQFLWEESSHSQKQGKPCSLLSTNAAEVRSPQWDGHEIPFNVGKIKDFALSFY